MATKRRCEKKTRKKEGWAVCVLEERIADFGLEIEISVPLFVDTAGK